MSEKVNTKADRVAHIPVEAYGVKGLSSKPWRKEFRDYEALNRWCEKNEAVVHGMREVI